MRQFKNAEIFRSRVCQQRIITRTGAASIPLRRFPVDPDVRFRIAKIRIRAAAASADNFPDFHPNTVNFAFRGIQDGNCQVWITANPDAHPLFHSDRGFQYTNRTFHHKLEKAGMTQSMSRVAKCIDNGPMEGFWGILKRERYYGRRFTSKKELVDMIEDYIRYYNNRRVQRGLGILTPMEKHNLHSAA